MYNSPLFWEHGAFLHPQHFQLARLNAGRAIRNAMSLLHPYLWGISRCEINEEALLDGVFEAVSLKLFLPTGEWAVLSENAVLPPRNFTTEWKNQDDPFTVYVALSEFKEQGGNVVRVDDLVSSPAGYRFVAPNTPEEVPDLYGDGPSAELFTLRYNLHIIFEGEESADMWKMPLARLIKNGERVVLDPTFAPPCVDIKASATLYRILRDIRDSLLVRSRQLDEYKILSGDTKSEAASSIQGMTLFCILSVVSRALPDLNLLVEETSVHPYDAYVVLSKVIGNLSVFSAQLNSLGEDLYGNRVLPVYNHEDPLPCFQAAVTIISRIVDSMVVGPAFMFTMEPDARGFLNVAIPQSARGGYAYWLLLRSAQSDSLLEDILSMGKLAPPSALTDIMGRSLPGIRLLHAANPPMGLPRRSNTLYFRIDTGDKLWQNVMEQGLVSFLLPHQPDDLLAQIILV